jgi:hypothetical protein
MWTKRLCPALLFAGSLILFLYTLAPTVTFVDSGELIVTARNLGVAHPPGFPLYLLVAHLATLLPLGNVAQRVHFASALSAALAVSVLYLITLEILLFLQTRSAKRNSGKPRSWKQPVIALERYPFIPGLVAGCLAAFSRTLWSYATVAEVYTLNALLILLTFLFLLRWRHRTLMRKEKDTESDSRPRRKGEQASGALGAQKIYAEYRLLYLAAFLFGLALGVHHVTVGLMLPAFAWLVYATEGVQFFKSRRLAICVLACLIGASIYAYIPWAAARAPILNWGNPNTIERFWSHITGKQYQSNLSFSPDQVGRETSSFVGLLFREFGWRWFPAGLALAGIGFVSLFRKDRALLISFVLMIGCNLIFAMGYEISEDKDAYYLPTFLLLAIAAGLGMSALLKTVPSRGIRTAAGIALLIPVLSFGGNFRINNRHNFFVAEDYVHNILRTISPNGLLLTGDWQVASPMLYFQEIAKQRRDVMCIDTLLLRRSWYCEYLESKYPGLMRKSRSSVQLFVEDLLRWEKEPEAFEKDPALVKRIEARYQAMIDALIQNHLPTAPVYATQDVMLNADPAGQPLAKSLLDIYQIVPEGLVFQLFPDRGTHQAELPKLETRGLMDGSPAVREDPVVRQKVIPVYVTMLVNCGRAFAANGDNGRALEAYRQAWAIDSSVVLARNLLPPGMSF